MLPLFYPDSVSNLSLQTFTNTEMRGIKNMLFLEIFLFLDFLADKMVVSLQIS